MHIALVVQIYGILKALATIGMITMEMEHMKCLKEIKIIIPHRHHITLANFPTKYTFFPQKRMKKYLEKL